MTSVPGGFLDHAHVDPPQRNLPQTFGCVFAAQCPAIILRRCSNAIPWMPGQHDLEHSRSTAAMCFTKPPCVV